MAPMMNSPRTARADLNGTSFAYETADPESPGARPVVFIHAGIADSRMWGDGSRLGERGHHAFSTLQTNALPSWIVTLGSPTMSARSFVTEPVTRP